MLKNKFARLAAISSGLILAAGGAMAQAADPTAAFTTAVTSVSTNIGTFGLALTGVAAVGVGFMVAVKYVKKIRGAA